MATFTKTNNDNMNCIMELWSKKIDIKMDADRSLSISQFEEITSKIEASNTLAKQLNSERHPNLHLTRSKSMIKKMAQSGETRDESGKGMVDISHEDSENQDPNVITKPTIN
jgi:hypothetical protein